jgi:hypothetical protein
MKTVLLVAGLAVALLPAAARAHDATPAVTADAGIILTGATGQERTLRAADLKELAPREIAVADPHSKEAAKYAA